MDFLQLLESLQPYSKTFEQLFPSDFKIFHPLSFINIFHISAYTAWYCIEVNMDTSYLMPSFQLFFPCENPDGPLFQSAATFFSEAEDGGRKKVSCDIASFILRLTKTKAFFQVFFSGKCIAKCIKTLLLIGFFSLFKGWKIIATKCMYFLQWSILYLKW